MKYFIAVDIGGTTFKTGLLSTSFNMVAISDKDKIRYYDNREEVVVAIIDQINSVINENKISKSDVIGIGIASPGPLDSKNGVILNTPNLKFFQNYKIASDFSARLNLDTFIENDANLFTLGEWSSQYRQNSVVMGVTLGTGLGFGLVINGKLFTGGYGMAMEYGLSPFEWGICEKNVCISFIYNRVKDLYGEKISPAKIEKYYFQNDKRAIKIYNEYGRNLGIVLSHVINMIDPQVITIGGGLSKAFNCFKNEMFKTLKEYAPSFNLNYITVAQSKLRERSTMLGAAMMVKMSKKYM